MKVELSNSSNIRILIAQQGMNLRLFSKHIGISQAYLSQILSGKRTPSPVVANKIAKGLNKKIDDIFFIQTDNKSNISKERVT